MIVAEKLKTAKVAKVAKKKQQQEKPNEWSFAPVLQ